MANSNTSAGPVYFDTPVRLFALAAVLWGVVGMLVGVIIAAQLAWPTRASTRGSTWERASAARP